MNGPQTQGRRPLTLIVAMTPYGVIGKDGKIPWNVPEDMQRFKSLTTGHAIVMGRKTFQSIGRPLPNRTNVVVSKTSEWWKPAPDSLPLVICATFDMALTAAYAVDPSPYAIGGAQIYADALPLATRLEITYILRSGIPGDTFFPTFEPGTHYPDVMTWKRVSMVSVGGREDVEFHTFVRRERDSS